MLPEEKIKELNFPKLESNRDPKTGDLVARLYQAGTSDKHYIVEADGTHYQGRIHKRRFFKRYKNEEGRYKQGFWQHYYEAEDGRWFDNSGWKCEKPKEQKPPPDYEL